MEDKELQLLVEDLINQGESEDVIAEVISQWEPAGKTQGLETEDATAVQEDGASNLEDSFSGLPTYEEVERQRHNEEAQIGRDTVAAGVALGGGAGAALAQSDLAVEAAASFMSGVTGLAQGVLDASSAFKFTAMDTFGQLFDPEYAAAVKEDPELKTALFNSMQTTLEDPSSDLVTQYAEGIVGSVGDGDWENAGRQLITQTAGAAPSLIATATGWGGMVTLGVSAMGGNFAETIEKSPESSSLAMLGTATLAGTYELASEYATRGILKKAGLVFGKGGKKAVDAYSKGIIKEIFKSYNIEGASEAGASLATHLTDNIVHGIDLPKNLLKQLADEYIIGGILGGGATAVGVADASKVVKVKAEPKEKKEQDTADAAKINALVNSKKNAASEEELSIIDDVIKETEEKIKSRDEKHTETVNDMTGEESHQVLKDTQEAEKYQTAISSNPDISPETEYIYTEKSNELKEKAQSTYEVVYEWPQTIQRSNEIKEEIDKKRKEIKQKEKTLAKSENPNPASTAKLNEEKADLDSKEKGLNEALDTMRPTVAEAKTRKKKSKKKVTEEVTEPVVERAESTQDALEIITDKSIPEGQKERAWKDFFKTNEKTIGYFTYKSQTKYGKTKTKKEVEAAIKAEVVDRLTSETTETGRKRGTKYDLTDEKSRSKFWNAVDQAVNRKFKGEEVYDDGVKVAQDPEYIEEKAYLDGLKEDGVLDDYAYELEISNLNRKFGSNKISKSDTTDLYNEEGDISTSVEKAYNKAQAETGVDNTAAITKALKDTSVDKIFKDWKNNTDKIYQLLPPAYHSKPEFQQGNPPIEIWEQFFSGEAGKKRRQRLKAKTNEFIKDAFDLGDTSKLDDTDIMEGAFEFLEGKKKPDVKTFLPLLSKLKRAFPGTRIVISKARMQEDFIEAGLDPAKAEGVKGYTDGKTVVLNPDKLDLETPIHEYGHIWAQATRSGRPDLYAKAEKLIKKSPYWLELTEKRDNQPDSVYYGYSDARLIEEAIATGIGKAGETLYGQNSEASAWDNLKQQIWEWLSAKVGFAKIEDLTLDNFLKLAVTEILTGEQLIKQTDFVAISNPDSMINSLEMKPGTTLHHGMPTKPLIELDYHGVRKTGKMLQELGKNVNKYYDDIKNGGWILWQTGKFGDDAKAAGKFDSRLSAIAQAKYDAADAFLREQGLRLKSVPGNASAYAVVPTLNFLESQDTPVGDKAKVLKKLLNNSYVYKQPSPYKKSKIDQKSREILEATKRDFAKRGHLLSEDQIDLLTLKLDEIVKNGKETQKAKNDNIKSIRKDIKSETADFVEITSGVDAENITQAEIDRKSKEKRNFFTDIAKGNFSSAFSRALSPDSNNDFYGLLYNLMPSGKGRAEAKQFIKETITAPLEDANYDQLETARAIRNNYKGLKQKHGITDKMVGKSSGVLVKGINLTNSQVVKVYNYIKNPKLYNQMKEGGVSFAKMEEILDYMDANPKLKKYADEVPTIFAGSKQALNSKLDQHGYKGVGEPTIVKPKPGIALDILARVYEGNIPNTAPYTPFTATGQDTTLDIDTVFETDGDFYSVMSGNLKERTGGGAMRIFGESLENDINTYINGPIRTMNYLDFARGASDVFSSKNIKAMDAAYGKEWGLSMRESLKAIITGKNRPQSQTKGQKAILNWMNRSVAGIMFFNVRSGVLQLISTGNFAVENPRVYAKGLSKPKAVKEAAKLIYDSAWFEERGKGKTGIEFDEVFGQESTTKGGRATDQLLQWGYAVTRLGDKGAILMGGAPYVAGRIQEGATSEEALQEFIAMAEETQQSARAERIGREQRSAFGRAILAFANTPMQYNRKMQKALKDMTAKEATIEERGAAASKILYYGAVQNVIFTSLQQALWTSLDLEDEKDEKGVMNALNSILDTILRGSGIIGASVAVVKNMLVAANQTERADQKAKAALKKGLGIAPALSSKALQLEKAIAGSNYPQSDGPITVPGVVTQSANAVQFVTNVPLTRAIKKFEGINDLGADDLNKLEKALRVGGWDRYSLGKGVQKDSAEAGFTEESPLDRGEDGQAFMDGTIEIDPKLKGEEREKAIAHEMQHKADIESGRLSYDDDYVYWDGEKYDRSTMNEGSEDLPWEQRAYEAESPLKRKTKGHSSTKSKREAARQSRIRQNEANERNEAIREHEYMQRFTDSAGNVDLGAMSEYEHLRGGGTVRNGGLVGNSTIWGLGGAAKGAIKAASRFGTWALKGTNWYSKYDDSKFAQERYQAHKDTGTPFKRKKKY